MLPNPSRVDLLARTLVLTTLGFSIKSIFYITYTDINYDYVFQYKKVGTQLFVHSCL